MYGLVFSKGTQTVVANLGRIDVANTGDFFRTYLGEQHLSASFRHGRDGSIVAIAGDLRVEVTVDAAEAQWEQVRRFAACATMSPARQRPNLSWDAVQAALRASHGDALDASMAVAA
jgi:hypothetical protein